jgi:ribonuclease HII
MSRHHTPELDETLALTRPVRQPTLLDAPPRRVRQCGLDEVGRGALAGPLVAAAVILPDDIADRLGALTRFLRDSKTVPRARREDLAAAIRAHALAVEVVSVGVEAINQHGIGWANRQAFHQLIAALDADEYIVDGRVRPPVPPDRIGRVRCMVKADALVPAVAAASLVAKVYRDALMSTLHQSYPTFGWDANAGYGTAAHLAALRMAGACPEHRTVFVTTALSGGQRARTSRRETAEPQILLE